MASRREGETLMDMPDMDFLKDSMHEVNLSCILDFSKIYIL